MSPRTKAPRRNRPHSIRTRENAESSSQIESYSNIAPLSAGGVSLLDHGEYGQAFDPCLLVQHLQRRESMHPLKAARPFFHPADHLPSHPARRTGRQLYLSRERAGLHGSVDSGARKSCKHDDFANPDNSKIFQREVVAHDRVKVIESFHDTRAA